MPLAHAPLIVLLAFSSYAAPLQNPFPLRQGSGGQAQTPPQQTTPPKPQAEKSKIDPDIELPVDLDRIQRALAKTPMLRFDDQNRPVFRVQVFGDKPTIDDILGPGWNQGPVPYGSMAHQEFLNMVTPTEARGYAGFTNKEGMIVAATSLALQWTLQKAIRRYKETNDQRERDAARKEVLDALAALEDARAKAGLTKK
jgi:hypothetical protein